LKRYESWLPLAILVLLGCLWGAMLVLGRIATSAGVPPMAFTFWNCAGGAAIIGSLALVRRVPVPASPRHLRYYAIAGLISNALPNTLAFTLVTPIGTGLTGVLFALSPLCTYAVAMAIGRDRFDPLRGLGLAVGLGGTLLILLPESSLPDAGALHWLLIGLALPVLLALGNIYRSAAWPPGTGSMTLAVGMLMATALLLLAAMAVSGSLYLPLPLEHDGDWATIGIFCVAGVVYVLYFELLRIAGPVYFSQISYVITASSVIGGMAVFGEGHSGWVWLAIAVIFTGVLLVNKRR
jgi:drug/metabolite transporter (DMT)-like permease